MSSLTEAAERFKTRTTYATSPIRQYGLPEQCYRDMLTLAKAAVCLLAEREVKEMERE